MTIPNSPFPNTLIQRLKRGWGMRSANGSTFAGAITAIADLSTLPMSNLTNGLWIINPDNAMLQLQLMGQGNVGHIGGWSLWGVRSVSEVYPNQNVNWWNAFPFMTGAFTLGTKFDPTGVWRYADVITPSITNIPAASTRIISVSGESAILEVDTRDFELMALQVSTLGAGMTKTNVLESSAGI